MADIRMVLRILSHLPRPAAWPALKTLGLHRVLPGRPGAPTVITHAPWEYSLCGPSYLGRIACRGSVNATSQEHESSTRPGRCSRH